MPLSFLMEALGGLGLFILGMKSMTEGLQKLAGQRLRNTIERLAGNRFTAVLLGSGLASLLQSGSTASIIVIGFVNAGLISLYQALAVLLGTGIGTTLAIQFIAFKISFFALPTIFIGVILKFFSSRRRWVNAGTLLLGAGLVFLGLNFMEVGFAPLKNTTLMHGISQHFLSWHVIAVLVGALLAFLIQSSSAAIGIVIALASSGLLNLDSAVAMVIGESLGSSLIAAIAAINGTLAARRTAWIYISINVLAIMLALLMFPLFVELIKAFSPGEAEKTVHGIQNFLASPSSIETKPFIARHLANAHTIFNLLTVFLFLPLIGFLARSASLILPGQEGERDIDPRPQFLDVRVVNTPSIALMQARNEIRRMAEVASSMYYQMVEQFNSFNVRTAGKLKQQEEVLDILQRDISGFIITLSRQTLSVENAMDIPTMLQYVNQFEHLGDQVEVIMEHLRRKKEEKLRFSNAAMSEIKTIAAQVSQIVSLAVTSFDGHLSESDRITVESCMTEINKVFEGVHLNHIKRLHSGKCSIVAGLLFSDIIGAFEKISNISYNTIKINKELE